MTYYHHDLSIRPYGPLLHNVPLLSRRSLHIISGSGTGGFFVKNIGQDRRSHCASLSLNGSLGAQHSPRPWPTNATVCLQDSSAYLRCCHVSRLDDCADCVPEGMRDSSGNLFRQTSGLICLEPAPANKGPRIKLGSFVRYLVPDSSADSIWIAWVVFDALIEYSLFMLEPRKRFPRELIHSLPLRSNAGHVGQHNSRLGIKP